jgi:hypothetical protein
LLQVSKNACSKLIGTIRLTYSVIKETLKIGKVDSSTYLCTQVKLQIFLHQETDDKVRVVQFVVQRTENELEFEYVCKIWTFTKKENPELDI